VLQADSAARDVARERVVRAGESFANARPVSTTI
jgi:hypothetical protein